MEISIKTKINYLNIPKYSQDFMCSDFSILPLVFDEKTKIQSIAPNSEQCTDNRLAGARRFAWLLLRIYWLNSDPSSPYQTKKSSILAQLILKYLSLTLCPIFQRFSIKNSQRLSLFWNGSNSVNIRVRKMFLQVRILQEIDCLCYQWTMLAKIRIVPAKLVEFYGVMPLELIGGMCSPTVPLQ